MLDLYFNDVQGKYSYTLIHGERRVLGWDNALHHPNLANFPHHFHREDGVVVPSPLAGVPEEDIEIVVTELNQFLVRRL